jgi:hypothetical protein
VTLQLPKPPWVQGWLVVRYYPPEFGAFFNERRLAEAKARELGPDFRVKLGDHLPGTDQFNWGTEDNAPKLGA